MTTAQPITPVLVYEDIQAAHDFLVEAFGLRSAGVIRDAADVPVHGEVRAGESAIWLHRVSAEHDLSAPGASPAAGGLAVTVDDVDAHHRHARAAGARIDSEPADLPYGRREYGARDPEGHRWWFGTPLR